MNTYFATITLSLATAILAQAVSIDAAYFAQTHVQKASDPYPTMVAGRDALIKVHVTDPGTPASPAVTAQLTLGASSTTLNLTGPATLPAGIPDGPGVVQHSSSNSFTATIPAAWVQPGLTVLVSAGPASQNITTLNIGAPTQLILTMADVHFFELNPGDYPAGWEQELEAKLPVSSLDVRRANDVVFPELVTLPRGGFPALRVRSKAQYQTMTGLTFDGENDIATAWNVALRRAAGRTTGYSLYYLNKYNVPAEGVAGGFSGVGTGTFAARGILLHELGHALSLPHWGDSATYPYKGAMHGIQPPAIYNQTHAGPTWAFHLPTRLFIPCTVQPNNPGGHPIGTYKGDPMQGGGTGYQEPNYIFNHFSDYSVNRMRSTLQNTVVVWNESLGSYAKWNATDAAYTTLLANNGVNYPLQRDQSVISVMAAVSGASPDVCMVYPPIGPYTAGLIRLFDPTNSTDRLDAQSIFAPAGGCDVTLRVIQGGVEKHYMLAASYNPAADPLTAASVFTEAVNLPAANGTITKVELLLTPDAEDNGLPANPEVLYTWTPGAAPTPNPASFAVVPAAVDSYSITMTATTGSGNSDFNGQIEYLFTETSGNAGGSTSGWQSSPTYTDLGLQPSTQYTYTVTIRSGVSKIATAPSAAFAATTAAGTATLTTLIARDAANTNGWLNGTWEPAIPSGTIDAQIKAGVHFRTSSVVPAWSGTLLFNTGSSMDIRDGGESVLQGPTSITLRNAGIYDFFDSNQTIPPIVLDGGGFFQCNNTSAETRSRTFNGSISGYGGFSTSPQRLMLYSFNQTNPFTGGYTLKAASRHVVAFNAVGAAGLGDVTVLEAANTNAPLSAVIRLGANDVFNRTAKLTLNGKGWNNLTGGAYPSRLTRIDMGAFSATVARLVIDGVEMPPGTYPGTSDTQDWIDGTGTLTVTGITPYGEWISGYPAVGFATGPTNNPDGDSMNNLQEFAFGMNPSVTSAAPLSWPDAGYPAEPGTPLLYHDYPEGGGVNFSARFMRRKDHGSSGSVSYGWGFSSNLTSWESSATAPGWYAPAAVLTEDPSGLYELVEVPYPFFLDSGRKARFFRIEVSPVP